MQAATTIHFLKRQVVALAIALRGQGMWQLTYKVNSTGEQEEPI
jgi:hypothetical protein